LETENETILNTYSQMRRPGVEGGTGDLRETLVAELRRQRK